MLQSGKLENLNREMEINEMDVIRLSEVRWEGRREIGMFLRDLVIVKVCMPTSIYNDEDTERINKYI